MLIEVDTSHLPAHWTVDGVLSAAECRAFVERIDAAGPTAAPVTTARGFVMRPDIRNNTRVILDDPATAADLFARVRDRVPAEVHGWRVVGANERLRCYKYEPGQRFTPHFDGPFVRDERERSLLTFMVYLNEGFEGGETRFLDDGVAVVPRAGTALFFPHKVLHEGAEVRRGVKYAVRSDVMYRYG